MWVEPGRTWRETFWSNISDKEVEEIAAKRVGYQVFLKRREVRPEERDTVFYCYKGSKPESPIPSAVPAKPHPPGSNEVWVLVESYIMDGNASQRYERLIDVWPLKVTTTDTNVVVLKKIQNRREVKARWREGFSFKTPTEDMKVDPKDDGLYGRYGRKFGGYSYQVVEEF
jgi:hypothetical protein